MATIVDISNTTAAVLRPKLNDNFDAINTELIATTAAVGTKASTAAVTSAITAERTATATLSGKSINGSANTLTNLPAGSILGVIPIANLATGTPNGTKFIRDDGTLQTIAGGGDALTSNPLSQFAATTSAQLRGVISDETGTGALVFAGGNIGAGDATTQAVGTNSTKIATAAYVQANQPTLMANANGILSGNTASANKIALQAIIDAYTLVGATIFFTDPVPMAGGILLKSNIKLAGNNFSALKGSRPVGGGSPSLSSTPSGAAFLIVDTVNVFITVQTNTSIDGIIFHYPNQAYSTTTPGSSLITYPATIKKTTGQVNNMSFTRLTFVGNTWCYDFYTTADVDNWSADIIIDQNYAYPLGGPFLKMKYCLDIPRITRCHINPGAGDAYLGHLPVTFDIIDWCSANNAPTFELEKTDEFMMSQCFAFGIKTAFFINDSYGVLVNCNADDSQTGVHVTITSDYKYLSLISFSAILSGGATTAARNAVVFDGTGGKLFCTNLHAVTSTPSSPAGANSLVKISGSGAQRVSLYGARAVAYDGVFDKFIDQVNGSAIVTYFDSDQQNVTNLSNPGQVIGLVQDTLKCSNATVAALTSETADTVVTFMINGQAIKFLGTLVSTVLFLDHFTGTNGTNLTAHTPDVGSAWTMNTGATTIQSNKASSPADSVVAVNMGAANGIITAAMNSPSGNNDAIVFRMVDANNYWRFQVNGIGTGTTNALIIDTTAASSNVVSVTSITMAAGLHTWKVAINGNNIEIFMDGVSIATWTSSIRASATIHGFTSSNAGGTGGSTCDDYQLVS